MNGTVAMIHPPKKWMCWLYVAFGVAYVIGSLWPFHWRRFVEGVGILLSGIMLLSFSE